MMLNFVYLDENDENAVLVVTYHRKNCIIYIRDTLQKYN